MVQFAGHVTARKMTHMMKLHFVASRLSRSIQRFTCNPSNEDKPTRFSLIFVVYWCLMRSTTVNPKTIPPEVPFGLLVWRISSRILGLALVALNERFTKSISAILVVAIPWIVASCIHDTSVHLILCWISTLLSTFVIWVFNGFNLDPSLLDN
jgi:hypothetical protein